MIGRRIPESRSEGGVVVGKRSSGDLIVDLRHFDPALRRTMVFALIDKLVELNSSSQLVLVCDHEPAGLGYQIDLRRESRGRYEFTYDRRSDGAWVAFARPKDDAPSGDKPLQ
jgi:uncharacterized protein (DUF2249 family)